MRCLYSQRNNCKDWERRLSNLKMKRISIWCSQLRYWAIGVTKIWSLLGVWAFSCQILCILVSSAYFSNIYYNVFLVSSIWIFYYYWLKIQLRNMFRTLPSVVIKEVSGKTRKLYWNKLCVCILFQHRLSLPK